MSSQALNCQRKGVVSVWVGAFPSVEASEAYFGIPDEIGVYLPPEAFARDLGLENLPAERLEVHFEQVTPRPLQELLRDARYSASFIHQAIEAASQQGIDAAQGNALLNDFDYQAKPGWQGAAGPLRFIGTFPFAGTLASQAPNRPGGIPEGAQWAGVAAGAGVMGRLVARWVKNKVVGTLLMLLPCPAILSLIGLLEPDRYVSAAFRTGFQVLCGVGLVVTIIAAAALFLWIDDKLGLWKDKQ